MKGGVFAEMQLVEIQTARAAIPAELYHAIGHVEAQLLVVVVFVDRSMNEQETIHIISVRKAEEYEQKAYAVF